MQVDCFIGVGENIHCTRIYKVGGKYCQPNAQGGHDLVYQDGKDTRRLPVPAAFTGQADWQAGRVKHCAVALWQGNYGGDAERAQAVDYLHTLARQQAAAGATYLDINVDEFSTDTAERVRLMQWTVGVVQQAVSIPMSIDSSNQEILQAGLQAASVAGRARPMVNSVSLERTSAIEVAARHGAVVIASAAGETGLPSTPEERLANFARLFPRLQAAGFALSDIHADPLVFPISTDGENGKRFLATVRAVRETYGPAIHIVAGLSNVSFGMPQRSLINQVFAHLAVEAGADGGIVDPLQINACILSKLDTAAEDYKLARALLLGDDEYGMNYIAAFRGKTL